MIKSWNKFFESNEVEFTEEMAQEIIYTFGEDSSGYNNEDPDLKDFLRSEIWEGITFYETGYDEMKEYTKTMLSKAQENPELKSECIRIYNYIREKNKIFPEVYQIEDIYLSLIEKYNFNFYVDIKMELEYKIKLTTWNRDHNLQEFITMCQEVERTVNRIESPKYKSILDRCEYHKRYVAFEVVMRKPGYLEHMM